MKLYELAEKYATLLALLDEDGADETGVKNQLEIIETEFKDKAESIGKIILSQTADVKIIEAEIDRLTSRKNSLISKTDWLKGYVLTEMSMSGVEQIKTATVSLTVRVNPPSVKILDLNLIPVEYRTIIPESWNPDKRAILEHLKSSGGEIVPGVEIVTDKKSLSVK